MSGGLIPKSLEGDIDIPQENPVLLDRLYKAARAYFLMREDNEDIDSVREELVAALVSVKMTGEMGPVLFQMSGEAHIGELIGELNRHADRRKEWAVVKVLYGSEFNTGTLLKPGAVIKLKPGEKIEQKKSTTRLP